MSDRGGGTDTRRRLGVRLLRPLKAPGLPRVPGFLALLVLRWPRLMPPTMRWKLAAKGLGLVVATQLARQSAEGGGRGASDVGRSLEEIGFRQGSALREQLGLGRTPLECAQAVALANRLYAIAAVVRAQSENEARVVTPGCPWSRESWWGQRPCGAFSRYEAGLTRGLNPRVSLHYESKRTRGDTQCVGVYRWRTADAGSAPGATLGVSPHQDVDQPSHH